MIRSMASAAAVRRFRAMVKASVRSLTSSSSFIAKAAFFTASESVEQSRGERRGQWEIKMDPLGER